MGYPIDTFSKQTRSCLWCGKDISHRHGSARYCEEGHKNLMAQSKRKEALQSTKTWYSPVVHNAKVLKTLLENGIKHPSEEVLGLTGFRFDKYSGWWQSHCDSTILLSNGRYGLFHKLDGTNSIVELPDYLL